MIARSVIPTPAGATVVLRHLVGAHGFALAELDNLGDAAIYRLHAAEHAQGDADHEHPDHHRPRRAR